MPVRSLIVLSVALFAANCLTQLVQEASGKKLPDEWFAILAGLPVQGAGVAGDRSGASPGKILLFVSYEDAYYSEYKVTLEALQAAGYQVEVASAASGAASAYSLSGDIVQTANSLPGSSYAQFLQQFEAYFGRPWSAQWNATVAEIPITLRIQDVHDMSEYAALVSAGGSGVVAYRRDGTYAAQGVGARQISAGTVQSAAEKLNELALDALSRGKPILFQCHGASLAVFFRIPGTSGPGAEASGYSLLKGQRAAGYPAENDGGETAADYAALDVTYRTDRAVASSPHSSFVHNRRAQNKIITLRDWHPQSIAYAVRILLNVLQTYPAATQLESSRAVLALHGGELTFPCDPSTRSNDVPCNHGGAPDDLPADITHLRSLLQSDSPLFRDDYEFEVTDVNLMPGHAPAPFNSSDASAILSYLEQFSAIVFFKHWSTGVTTPLQQALIAYADRGGGVVAIHHGLYNEPEAGFSKDLMIAQLFQAESSNINFGLSLQGYNLHATNYGHFIATYGIEYSPPAASQPGVWGAWDSISAGAASGLSLNSYQNLSIADELYANIAFRPGVQFGRDLNQITPIFSNDAQAGAAAHVSGFVRRFDASGDGSVGRLAYLQPGERRINYAAGQPYAQVIRNAVAWASAR